MTYLINSYAKVQLFFISANFFAKKNFNFLSIFCIFLVSKPKFRNSKGKKKENQSPNPPSFALPELLLFQVPASFYRLPSCVSTQLPLLSVPSSCQNNIPQNVFQASCLPYYIIIRLFYSLITKGNSIIDSHFILYAKKFSDIILCITL